MRTLRLAATAIVLLAIASPLGADVTPVGPELQANTYTTGPQFLSAVGMDGAGNFVVVWQSGYTFYGPTQDGSDGGVFAQRFAATGTRLGSEFQANTYTTGPQALPAVAVDAAGRFVVAWTSGSYYSFIPFTQDGSETGAFLQRYDATGIPLGPERQVNTFTKGPQGDPAVAADAAGNFVVVWESGYSYSGGPDGSAQGVFGQRYDSSGVPLGGEFQVNTYTTGSQRNPAVASDPTGNFVVAWESGSYASGQDGDRVGIFGQRFDATGARVGPEFQVNTYTTGYQTSPSITADAAGNFVVVWQTGYYGGAEDGSSDGVFAQRFTSGGVPVGSEFQVNTYTTGAQNQPRVAADAAGNFLVVWQSRPFPGQDGDRSGVFGQHFSSAGARLGREFQVNTYTTGPQGNPAVAANAAGDFVVSWTSGDYYGGQDGSYSAIVARRLQTTATAPPVPVAGARLVLRDDPSDATRKALLVRSQDGAIGLGGGDGSADDPTLSGGRLRVQSDDFDTTYELPRANWRYIGAAGQNRGYVYRDPQLLAGPIQLVRLRNGRQLRVVGRGAALGHALAANPDPVRVVFQTGGAGRRDCMTFGGTATYRPGSFYRAAGAPASPCDP